MRSHRLTRGMSPAVCVLLVSALLLIGAAPIAGASGADPALQEFRLTAEEFLSRAFYMRYCAMHGAGDAVIAQANVNAMADLAQIVSRLRVSLGALDLDSCAPDARQSVVRLTAMAAELDECTSTVLRMRHEELSALTARRSSTGGTSEEGTGRPVLEVSCVGTSTTRVRRMKGERYAMRRLTREEVKDLTDREVRIACERIKRDYSFGLLSDTRTPIENTRLLEEELRHRGYPTGRLGLQT